MIMGMGFPIQLLVAFLYLYCAEGLSVGAMSRPDTGISWGDSMLIDSSELKEAVMESIILARRNAPAPVAEDKTVLDENGKYIGKFSPECRETLLMSPARHFVTLSPTILDKGQINCHWEIIGTGNCIPMISCPNFTLVEPTGSAQQQDVCHDEYLEVTDGSYGYKTYCGQTGPLKTISGRGYRDIYVTLKLSQHEKNRTLVCNVSCVKDEGDEKTNSLDETAQAQVNHHCKCGHKSVPELKRDANREGNAKRGEFPWVAALVAAGSRKPFCAGSIINDRFILTAAHCLRGDFASISGVEILIHPHELNVTDSVSKLMEKPVPLWTPEELKIKDDGDQSYRYTISRYFVHPLFVKQIHDFDVALIKLDRHIDFKELRPVVPVCLPDNGLWDQTKEGASAIIAGWGSKDQQGAILNTSSLAPLKKQHVEVYKYAECQEAFDWRHTHRMLCAGHRQEKNFCMGDNGGPLISEKSRGIWEQIGIQSYAEGCVSKCGPGLYTDLRQIVQWIRYVSSLEQAVWCSG